MAKVADLLRRVQVLVDDTPDTADVIDWFNQCQDNLSNVLYMPVLTTIDRDIGTGLFLMPSDCNGELKILTPVGIDIYSVYGDSLYFEGSDAVALTQIQVTYNKFPDVITNNPEQIPSIKSQFHDVYVPFACMQLMHPEEEPDRYAQYERDYNRIVSQINKFYGKLRPKPTSWKVVR